MSGELSNCPQCGEVFVKGVRTICQKCVQEEEEDFEKVYGFIRKRQNRQATITEVMVATGVDGDRIMRFVKEKRLRTTQFPNLSYGCDLCGGPIQEGRICDNCSRSIKMDWKKEQEIDKVTKANKEKEAKINTYYSVKKGKKYH